jgi:hypothetical protein
MFALTLLLLSAPPALRPSPAALQVSAPSETSELRTLVEQFAADEGILRRTHPNPLSPMRTTRMRAFLDAWQKTLEGVDFERLSRTGKVDWILFHNDLRFRMQNLEQEAVKRAETEPILSSCLSLITLDDSRRRMEQVNPPVAAQLLTDVEKSLGAAVRAVESGGRPDGKPGRLSIPKSAANRAALEIGQIRQALAAWFRFYDGYDPMFTWWCTEPYKAVDKALARYSGIVRERLAGLKPGDENAIVGDPIGREALISELAHEMIPYTPEELFRIAEQEFAWCEVEMKRAAADLGFNGDWKKALEHVKNLHVPPGQQPQMIRELAVEAIDYMEKNDLVTIPPLAKETWRMEMMSPERQLVSPFFLGGETILVSYPTASMTHEQKLMSMRGNNRHFSRATVQHELIPGHHLQGFMTARHMPWRRTFDTPFWVEGYALYWEMFLWDRGFPKSAEDRVGMLFWRSHRCARILFSLGFHLGKMTPEQCIDLLVNRVGHERANAEAEVRRSFGGAYGPLYQAAYMVGGLQIRGLYKELVESGKMPVKAFHDALYRQGGIPIELIRASLTGQPLTRDFRSTWKFYGDVKDPAR